MTVIPDTADALAALRDLTLDEVEPRHNNLDAARAALTLLRRSPAARDRARRRAGQSVTNGKLRRDG